MKRTQVMLSASGILLIFALAGCKRDEATVYQVPKDDSTSDQPAPTPSPGTAPATPTAPASSDNSLPRLTYKLPVGWQEKPPSEMRVASFNALGPGGQSADVAVIPLGIVGRDQELINMWRSQVQLPPISSPDAATLSRPVAIGSGQGDLFEFVSEQPMLGKSRQRVMIARLTRNTMSWFFRMAGEDEFVASQKEKFLQFLKSVSFDESATDAPRGTSISTLSVQPSNTASGGPTDGSATWTIPPGWQTTPPSQFLLAEFTIFGTDNAKAEVNVARLDGDGGGLLANVNRWRGQLGLGPVSDDDLPQIEKSIDVPGGSATLVDLTGAEAKTGAPMRLIGVVVPQNGQTWFYKLMGDQQVVAQQEDAFMKFIISANYANAR